MRETSFINPAKTKVQLWWYIQNSQINTIWSRGNVSHVALLHLWLPWSTMLVMESKNWAHYFTTAKINY